MSDEIKIDGNAIYKHVRKLYSEKEYRQRFNRLDFYKPTPKQIECHNDTHRQFSVRAGNRAGKTNFVCVESSFQQLQRRPSWHHGWWKPKPNIARPWAFVEWMIGPNSTAVRDVMQAQMLGGYTQDTLGTGWLPLSALRHDLIMARGISGLVDKVTVTRDDGDLAVLSFKTQEMSVEAFQGDAVDLIVLDEDPGKAGEELLPELLARTIGTGGRFIHTATPRAGSNTALRKFFKEPGHPERGEIRMSIYDNTYLTPEDIKAAESQYTERQRMCRLYGDDLPGFGAVFDAPEDNYLHDMRPETVPTHWPWINGMDFSHFGGSSQAHPWAFVSCCIDPASGTMYVFHELRIKQQLPPVHVAAVKKWEMWDAPTAYGADGAQRDSTGSTFANIYKSHGLRMRPSHATLKDGGVSLEATLAMMQSAFSDGSLKIGRWLTNLRQELRDFSYDENNKVIAEADDLVSALRYAFMDRRYAKRLTDFGSADTQRGWEPGNFSGRKNGTSQTAKGLDFLSEPEFGGF